MAALAFTIDPDELLGLSALIEMGRAADTGDADPVTGTDAVRKARALMRRALADELEEAGLPWAPSAEAVRKRAAAAAPPASAMSRLSRNKKVRKYLRYVMTVAVLVVLWGGYIQRWKWTGFPANDQLWDWLSLLLLPVVLGTIPLWIQNREFIGRPRRVAYAVVIMASAGFVIASYLIPLNWTGFPGQTLWTWFELILLPVALTGTMALTSTPARPLRPYQQAVAAALVTGWIVTVIGGYALQWAWTGYAGNTLWDWLGLLLLPLVFPTILLPALLKWVSGDAAGRATQAREAAIAHTGPPAGRMP